MMDEGEGSVSEWQPIETVPLSRLILVHGIWQGEINGADRAPDIYLVSTDDGKYFPVHGSEAYAAWVNNPTLWAELPALAVTAEQDERDGADN